MMWRILTSDALKLRRTWIIYLALLAPVGLIGLMSVVYAFNYDHLVHPGHDNWQTLLNMMHMLTVMSLLLGSGILASMFLGVEHQSHSWKLLKALPISRVLLLVGKFLWLTALLALSSSLLAIGDVVLGAVLHLGEIPWKTILTESFAPFLATLPVLALQIWLSSVFQNQAVPILISVLGLLVGTAANVVPRWLPWVYPSFATPLQTLVSDPHPWVFAWGGAGVACVLLAVGASHFATREVK